MTITPTQDVLFYEREFGDDKTIQEVMFEDGVGNKGYGTYHAERKFYTVVYGDLEIFRLVGVGAPPELRSIPRIVVRSEYMTPEMMKLKQEVEEWRI